MRWKKTIKKRKIIIEVFAQNIKIHYICIVSYLKRYKMKYFLRYTENANEDLERNESYHASGLNEKDCTIDDVAAMSDCDRDWETS